MITNMQTELWYVYIYTYVKTPFQKWMDFIRINAYLIKVVTRIIIITWSAMNRIVNDNSFFKFFPSTNTNKFWNKNSKLCLSMDDKCPMKTSFKHIQMFCVELGSQPQLKFGFFYSTFQSVLDN